MPTGQSDSMLPNQIGSATEAAGGAANAAEIDNIIQDELVDINRFRYNL